MGIFVRLRRHIRSHLIGYVALFLALSVAPAWALAKNSIRSKHIVNGQVKTQDLGNRAVKGKKVGLPLNLNGTVDNDPGPPIVPKATLQIENTGNGSGISVSESGSYGVVVGGQLGDTHLMSDAFRIYETGDDGIQVGSDPNYPNYGLYIPSPGVSTYGLWPNTANNLGQWALFTVDGISAANVQSSTFRILAKVSGGESLEAGEIVTATGVASPLPGSVNRLVRVGTATKAEAVVGVVESRMVFEPAPGKKEAGLRSAAGPARAGDYVALTTLGVANVRLAPGVQVDRGDRLTAASGLGRVLRTTRVDGITVAEDAAWVGVALGSPNNKTHMVPVFVMPR